MENATQTTQPARYAVRTAAGRTVHVKVPAATCRACGGDGRWWTGATYVAKNCRACRGTGEA